MSKNIQVGTAHALPGQITYGYFEALEVPTGITERLPVVIVQGKVDGPVFWFTANIHGNELTGIPALHETLTQELADELRGTIVAIPSLNPSGLRTLQRTPHYDNGDPNRTFPGWRRSSGDSVKDHDEQDHPSIYEEIFSRLYVDIRRTADYLIDLHCANVTSVPFSIRDRVLYHVLEEGAEDEARAEAQALSERLDSLLAAFGLPIVNEYTAKRYLNAKLHRSTSGAALNEARVPAFTAELGSSNFINLDAVTAAKTALRNALKWAGMLDGTFEPVTTVPTPKLDFPNKRDDAIRAPATGFIRYLVRGGDVLNVGDPICTLRDIHGRSVTGEPDAIVRADQPGWVMATPRSGIVYKNQTLLILALRDDDPMVVPFPKD